jgi:RimJ/RimL family protein N-acetyltransferase
MPYDAIMGYSQTHLCYRELVLPGGLRLIEPSLSHADESLLWVLSAGVMDYMGADFSHPSLEGEKKRLQEIIENKDEYAWMIEYEGKVIGNVSINSISSSSEKIGAKAGNMSILIGSKDHWGRGIAAKASAAVLEWAFSEGGFECILARALQENIASIKLLKKLGFEECGIEAYEGLVRGEPSYWKNFSIKSTKNA